MIPRRQGYVIAYNSLKRLFNMINIAGSDVGSMNVPSINFGEIFVLSYIRSPRKESLNPMIRSIPAKLGSMKACERATRSPSVSHVPSTFEYKTCPTLCVSLHQEHLVL